MAGVGAALIFWQVGFGWVTVGLVIAFWIGLVIFWIDLRDYIIPDGAVLALLGAALLVRLGAFPTLESGLIGALVGTGILGSLVLVTRGRGMGLGDVKLALPLGLLWVGQEFSWDYFWLLYLVRSLGLVNFAHRRGWRDAVPFGPFACRRHPCYDLENTTDGIWAEHFSRIKEDDENSEFRIQN